MTQLLFKHLNFFRIASQSFENKPLHRSLQAEQRKKSNAACVHIKIRIACIVDQRDQRKYEHGNAVDQNDNRIKQKGKPERNCPWKKPAQGNMIQHQTGRNGDRPRSNKLRLTRPNQHRNDEHYPNEKDDARLAGK